jgi:hypothetical protein
MILSTDTPVTRLEIEPCRVESRDQRGEHVEQCSAAEAEFWTVYLRAGDPETGHALAAAQSDLPTLLDAVTWARRYAAEHGIPEDEILLLVEGDVTLMGVQGEHVAACASCGVPVEVYLIDRPATDRPCLATTDRDHRLNQHGHRVPREAYDAWIAAGRPTPEPEPEPEHAPPPLNWSPAGTDDPRDVRADATEPGCYHAVGPEGTGWSLTYVDTAHAEEHRIGAVWEDESDARREAEWNDAGAAATMVRRTVTRMAQHGQGTGDLNEPQPGTVEDVLTAARRAQRVAAVARDAAVTGDVGHADMVRLTTSALRAAGYAVAAAEHMARVQA